MDRKRRLESVSSDFGPHFVATDLDSIESFHAHQPKSSKVRLGRRRFRARHADGQPVLVGVAISDAGAPGDQHADPGIAPAGDGIPRDWDRERRRGCLVLQGGTQGRPPASSSAGILPVISP